MLRLDDSWVWDFWTADDGELYHLFFLHAPRSLGNPDDRHYNASIGHAVSTDLTNWRRLDDAVTRSDAPAFDDLATWTGSIVQHPDGTWYLYYTGTTLHDGANAEILRLEALRDAAGQALQAARAAHGDLRGASAIWGWLPDSLEKGNVALQACREVSSGATPKDIAIE